MKLYSFLRNRVPKGLSPVSLTGSSCIILADQEPDRVFCTLSERKRDDALILISEAIDQFGQKGESIIEFASFPNEGYQNFLARTDSQEDSIAHRAEYLLDIDCESRKKMWAQSGSNFADASLLLLFRVKTPHMLHEGDEYSTKYRLTEGSCRRLTELLTDLYQDAQVFVSREIIHWGDYLVNPDRFYQCALMALNGEGRCYFGRDLEQNFGTMSDPRFLLPLLAVHVVVRRFLPHTILFSDAEKYLTNMIQQLSVSVAKEVASVLLKSDIELLQLYDRLLPYSGVAQIASNYFSKRGLSLVYQQL